MLTVNQVARKSFGDTYISLLMATATSRTYVWRECEGSSACVG